MIVVASRPGQLGNMLFLFAHLVAFCREHNLKLVCPAFRPYDKYFPALTDTAITYPRGFKPPFFAKSFRISNLCARLLSRVSLSFFFLGVTSLDWHERLDLDVAAASTFRPIQFLLGWQFRGPRLLEKHQETVKNLLQPHNNLMQKVDSRISDLKKENGLLIGVHIRQGDYATFEGGRYFYTFDQYEDLMTRLRNLFDDKATLLVCSNVKLDKDDRFKGLSAELHGGTEMEDLYALSQCDLIMGPPSTFSLWASFFGDTPIFHVESMTQSITKEVFKIPEHF